MTELQRPDPTPLTTQALLREVESLKELMFTRLEGLDEKIETRLTAMDKAVQIFSDNLTRVPTETDKAVGNFKELVFAKLTEVNQRIEAAEHLSGEKFAGVEVQFSNRDTAVQAALQAQKEAAFVQAQNFKDNIEKSERVSSNRTDELRMLLEKTAEGSNAQISDLKQWKSSIEGAGFGRTAVVTETRAAATDVRGTIALAISGGAVLLAAIGVILAQGRA